VLNRGQMQASPTFRRQAHWRNTIGRMKFREGNYRPERKTGKDLYISFMEQNLDASRILILESALDPVQPGPELE
jgi:hypothetical protein